MNKTKEFNPKQPLQRLTYRNTREPFQQEPRCRPGRRSTWGRASRRIRSRARKRPRTWILQKGREGRHGISEIEIEREVEG